MDVILLERIERLGQMGDVVKVRPGFARNFLLPQNKALRATKANVELFEKQRADHEARNAAARGQAEAFGKKIDGLKLIVIRQASETGQLYGSVSGRDVADAAKEAGHEINRAQVQIDTPIKALGLYDVKVKLHAEVTVKVTINVARSPEEASVQADKHAAAARANKEKADVTAAFGAPPEAEVKDSEDATEAAPKKKAKKETRPANEDEAEEKAEAREAKPKKAKAAKAKKE
ncbi:MAG: 50S ribosomal protein L9 [Bdellovibrionales bacterium]